jgi:hypothetical protein
VFREIIQVKGESLENNPKARMSKAIKRKIG